MRRLTLHVVRWNRNRVAADGGERGVVAILLALVLGGGLAIGMLALTVDVGRLFVERRAVQNGADAAAMAVAEDCAQGAPECAPGGANGRAGSLADANAEDGTSIVGEVCGSVPFAPCAEPRDHAWECQDPSAYARYVRVRTATREFDGSTVIAPAFADVLTPEPGTGMWACAQAAWGAASSGAPVLPFALSICDYRKDGTLVSVSFPNNESTRSCTVVDADGIERTYDSALTGLTYFTKDGFTFDCVNPVPVAIGDTLTRQNVASTQQVCGSPQPSDKLDALIGKDVTIPMVGNVETNGQGSYPFTVISFARVTLLGYYLQNQSTMGGTPPPGLGTDRERWAAYGCEPGWSCLHGTFTTGVSAGTVDPTGPNTGLVTVQLIP